MRNYKKDWKRGRGNANAVRAQKPVALNVYIFPEVVILEIYQERKNWENY